MKTTDPMERIIEGALIDAGIPYKVERQNPAGLDFYLQYLDLYIEVKRMHSPRISEQMSRAKNVIAVQGEPAIQQLAAWIRGGAFKG